MIGDAHVLPLRDDQARSSGLCARGLSAFYGKVAALDDIDLNVCAGEIVTVVGPNGAGKSTLLGALMGRIRIDGCVSLRKADLRYIPPERRVSMGLALVPETRDLFGSMSVEDNLLLGGFSWRKAGRHALSQELQKVFELFPRLEERRRQTAHTLSGGERQMLALGRALMSRPRVLMLDEPSLGLAPLVMREIFATISRLRQTGVALLLVEQNARAAFEIADYAYVLEMGCVSFHGPAADVASDPRVEDSYLGRRDRARGNASSAAETVA